MTNKALPVPPDLHKGRFEFLVALLIILGIGSLIYLFKTPLLLFILIAVLSVVLIFWVGSQYFALAIFVLLPFSVEIPITEDTRLTLPTEILIPILFLLFGLSLLKEKGHITFRPSPINIPLILMYIIMVASLAISQEKFSTMKAIIRDTGYIITGFYLIPMYIREERHLKQFLYGCLITHTLIVCYGFITQAMGGIRIYDDIASPFFVEHCIYAAYITISFAFLMVYLLDQKPGPIRNALGVITALFGLAIVLTFVRAAWFSIILMLAYYLLYFRHRRSSVDLIFALIVALIVGITALNLTNVGKLLVQRISTITDTDYVANFDRIDRWYAAANMWRDYPYYGVGWGAYPDIYPDYQKFDKAFSKEVRMGAHNLYLEVLAETGVIGLFFFLLLLYVFFRQALLLQIRTKSRFKELFLVGMQGAMITYLVHAFLNNLGPSDKISLTFWFLLGMIPTMNYLISKEEESSIQEKVEPAS